jgi:putative acetyltransferase
MSVVISRERPDTGAAVGLISELDAQLAPRYPAESRHGFSVATLLAEDVPFFVLRYNGVAASCGAIKLFGTEYGEIKRMYVRSQFRSMGFGKLMLNHLTDYAQSHSVKLLRLETGIHQLAAISLYERMEFMRIPPFGAYKEDPLSLFFEKRLGGSVK